MGRGKIRTDKWMGATGGCGSYKCMPTRTPTHIPRGSLGGHMPAERILVDTCAHSLTPVPVLQGRCRWVHTSSVPSMYLAHPAANLVCSAFRCSRCHMPMGVRPRIWGGSSHAACGLMTLWRLWWGQGGCRNCGSSQTPACSLNHLRWGCWDVGQQPRQKSSFPTSEGIGRLADSIQSVGKLHQEPECISLRMETNSI